MMTRFLESIFYFFLAFLVSTPLALAQVERGGSNYFWYDLDSSGDLFSYGALCGYSAHAAEIGTQLASMRAQGQERLVIGIHHTGFSNPLNQGAGAPPSGIECINGVGTYIDSTGGNFAQTYRNNLASLLSAAKAAGFTEVLVRYLPGYVNDPGNWDPPGPYNGYHADVFQENWNLIANLQPIIAGAGLTYRIDLGAERMPAVNQSGAPYNPNWFQYCKNLWINYATIFGIANTVGYSIAYSASSDGNYRAHAIKYVYNGTPPYVFAVTIYGPYTAPGGGMCPGLSEEEEFSDLNAQLTSDGFQQGIIIAEAYYNDAVAAEGFSQAIASTGRTVWYLTQWPFERPNNASCGASVPSVNVIPPTAFNNYSSKNF